MNCRIPSTNVRHFTKAITCLTKIGEAINFEISPNRFVLRTLGEGDATYFQIDFEKGKFFDRYTCWYHNDGGVNGPNGDHQSFTTMTSEASKTIKARINSKVFLSTLRLIDGAKSIELKFDTDVHKLNVIITLSENRKRKYGIHFEDIPNILQADFDADPTHVKEMCCQSNTFKRVLTNFVNSLQEITLILTEQGLAIKSFIDITDPMAASDSIQTEYHLKKNLHFTKFDIELPEEQKQIILTVVQKEYKSFLHLCEALDEPIKIYMTFGGAPICLTNKTPIFWLNHLREEGHHVHDEVTTKGITLKLIMATISDEDQEIELPRPPKHPSTISNGQSLSESAALNARRVRKEQQESEQHQSELESVSSDPTQLAQNQSIMGSVKSSRSNRSRHRSSSRGPSQTSSNAMHLDDDDVLIGLPTHDGFANDDLFLQQHTQVAQTTVVNDTEIEDNITVNTTSQKSNRSHQRSSRSQKSNSSNKNNQMQRKKNRYAQFQPHPDSITPPAQNQQMQRENAHDPFNINDNRNHNNRNEGNQRNMNFDLNQPEIDNTNTNKKSKYSQYDARSRRILPLSSQSQSDNAQRQRQRQAPHQQQYHQNTINLIDDDQANEEENQGDNNNMQIDNNMLNVSNMDSLELQFTASDNNKNNQNDNGSDYLASLLDYDEFDRASSLTQTQPVIGGQIADRYRERRSYGYDDNRDRDRDRNRNRNRNKNRNSNKKKERKSNKKLVIEKLNVYSGSEDKGDQISDIHYLTDREIIYGNQDGEFKWFNMDSTQLIHQWKVCGFIEKGDVCTFDINKSRDCMVYGNGSHQLQIYDLKNKKYLRKVDTGRGRKLPFSFASFCKHQKQSIMMICEGIVMKFDPLELVKDYFPSTADFAVQKRNGYKVFHTVKTVEYEVDKQQGIVQ